MNREQKARRLAGKSRLDGIQVELQQGYNLSPVEAQVLARRVQQLVDEYGAPLRMMFPAKYGYKSAKAVTAVTFTDEGGAGYWSTVGAYTTHGDIQPGGDFPQDLPGERKQIEGGEITAY